MEFTFTLTEDEANLMLAALMELPYKVSNNLIQKVNQQAMDQREKPIKINRFGITANVPGQPV